MSAGAKLAGVGALFVARRAGGRTNGMAARQKPLEVRRYARRAKRACERARKARYVISSALFRRKAFAPLALHNVVGGTTGVHCIAMQRRARWPAAPHCARDDGLLAHSACAVRL